MKAMKCCSEDLGMRIMLDNLSILQNVEILFMDDTWLRFIYYVRYYCCYLV